MNDLEINQSLDNIQLGEVKKKTVWVDGVQNEIEIQYEPGDNQKVYYEAYIKGGSFYGISELNYKRIQEAIVEGAKFVRINNDLVNVNEIKRFKKVS